MLAMLLGLLVGWIFADWSLHLDSPFVRGAALGGVLLLIGGLGVRHLYRPWASSLRDVDLALLLERRSPELRGNLASAVEFSSRTSDAGSAAPPLSELESELVDSMETRLSRLPAGDIIDTSSLLRAGGLAALTVALLAAVLWSAPGATSIALTRLAVPWRTLDWPRRHTLEFLDVNLRPLDESVGLRVAEGEPLTLYVGEHRDDLPTHISLEVRHADGQTDSHELRQASLRDGQGVNRPVAVVALTPTRGPIELTARGGDDSRLPPLRIEVAPPPSIERFEIVLTPPAYSGKPPETITGGVGHLQGLVGTQARITAVANTPLRSATLHRGSQRRENVPLAEDRRTMSVSLEIESAERTSYWLELTDELGLQHANPPRYEIRGIVDREPAIRIVQPDADLRVQPDAEIPFQLEASDDWGLQRIELIVSLPGSAVPEEVRLLHEFPNTASTRDARPESLVKVREWNASPGTQLSVRGQAVDGFNLHGKAGQATRSAPRLIEIVSLEQKRQELAGRQAGVAESLERARTIQSQIREQLGELEIQWEKTGRLRDEDRATVARMGLAQQQVREELLDTRRGAERRVSELLQEVQWNRLDDDKTRSRLEEVQRELKHLAEKSLPQVDSAVGELERTPETSTGQTPQAGESLKKARSSQKDVLDILDGILADLAGWRQQEDVRRRVGELLSSQQTLADETRDLAGRTLSKAVSNLTPQEQADVARLADRQGRLANELKGLEELGNPADSPADPKGVDPELGKKVTEALDPSDAVAKLRQASGMIQENRLRQASDVQQEVLETLRKLDSSLSGDADNSPETLVKRIEEAQREAAGLREQQSRLRRDLQDIASQPAGPSQKESLATLKKQQAELEDRAASFAQRLRKRDLSQPSASARRGAERMTEANDALEDEDVPEAVKKQGEAIDDLLQAERELEALEQQARVDSQVRALQQIGQSAGRLADRQREVRAETVRLDQIRIEGGKLTRAQLRTLQQTRENQEGLAGEIESLAGGLREWPVLELAAQTALAGARDAAKRLSERTTDQGTQERQSDVASELDRLAASLAQDDPSSTPSEDDPMSPPESGPAGEPSADGAAKVAELKLLKGMQEDLLDRTSRLLSARKGELTGEQQAQLKELAARQQKLAELAESLLKPADAPESPPP